MSGERDGRAAEPEEDVEERTRVDGPHFVAQLADHDHVHDHVHDHAAASAPAPEPGAFGPTSLSSYPPASSGGEPESRDGRFDDLGEISRGGMGAIRHVVHKSLFRHEAMKVLDPSIAEGSPLAAQFLEEARIMGQLDHPNIVPVYDLGLTPSGSPSFFTMKLVRGQTFGAYLEELGAERLRSPHLERVLESLIKVCDAISFAHSRGIIHCDLKPSNVMIGSHGQVYVMDWGIALFRGSPLEMPGAQFSHPTPGTLMGTPSYMAPEQATGEVDKIDERTDIYGLGGLLYRILTGRPPHMGKSIDEMLFRARRVRVRPPEEIGRTQKLHAELCRIAMKALASAQRDRYQSVDELKHDLETFLRGDGWLPTQMFKEGTLLIREGEIANVAYIIVEGRCEVYKTVDGKKVSLRFMGPGEVFGETAIFASERRTASVVALGDVTVKVVTHELLEMEFSRSTWMGALVRSLAGRFREVDAQLTGTRDPGKA